MGQELPETYKVRKRHCEQGQHRTIWVGAGLVGLVALASGDAFNDAGSDWLKATEVTLIILSGVCLAIARVNFEWEKIKIETKLEDNQDIDENNEIPLCECLQNSLAKAKKYWTWSLILLFFAGLSMIICFWYPTFTNKTKNKEDLKSANHKVIIDNLLISIQAT